MFMVAVRVGRVFGCFQEREEMAKLMKQQHETEKNELTYMLKLEQDEESEKIRKVSSILQYVCAINVVDTTLNINVILIY